MKSALFAFALLAPLPAVASEATAALPYSGQSTGSSMRSLIPACADNEVVGVSGTRLVCKNIPTCLTGQNLTFTGGKFSCVDSSADGKPCFVKPASIYQGTTIQKIASGTARGAMTSTWSGSNSNGGGGHQIIGTAIICVDGYIVTLDGNGGVSSVQTTEDKPGFGNSGFGY